MEVLFAPRFSKQYRKLSRQLQDAEDAVDAALARFQQDPFDPSLRNHPLMGKLEGLRALMVGYDLRLIYEEESGFP